MTASGADAAGKAVPLPLVTWSSTDALVLAISGGGSAVTLVPGRVGTATVIAQAGSVTSNALLATVVPGSPSLLARTTALLLLDSASTSPPVFIVTDAAGNRIDPAPLSFSSRTGRVSVNATGQVRGLRAGTDVLVAQLVAAGRRDSVAVVVAPVGGLVVLADMPAVQRGQVVDVLVSVVGRGTPRTIGSSQLEVRWDPAVLTYVSDADPGSGVNAATNPSVSLGRCVIALASATGYPAPVAVRRFQFRAANAAAAGQLLAVATEIHSSTFADLLPLTVGSSPFIEIH